MKCEISEVWLWIIVVYLRFIEVLFVLYLFLSIYIYIVYLVDSCKLNIYFIYFNGFGEVFF